MGRGVLFVHSNLTLEHSWMIWQRSLKSPSTRELWTTVGGKKQTNKNSKEICIVDWHGNIPDGHCWQGNAELQRKKESGTLLPRERTRSEEESVVFELKVCILEWSGKNSTISRSPRERRTTMKKNKGVRHWISQNSFYDVGQWRHT